MKQTFDNNRPIYLQIMDEVKLLIVSGTLEPGSKMESVRDMAQKFGVNPNTMQRALQELEREKLVFTERTSGRFITLDGGLIMTIRDCLAEEELKRFLNYMEKIGYTKEKIIEKIQNNYEVVKQNG